MTGEDPDPTAARLLVWSARPADSVPRRGKTRKSSDDGSPSPHLDASRDASVSDVCSLPSFDFQRRAPGWCPVRDPILWEVG
jgi:hypothetical protein